MNKKSVVETHSISEDEIKELLSLAAVITEDFVQLGFIAEVDDHKQFLRELSNKTNIPKPVLEYIFFNQVTGYR